MGRSNTVQQCSARSPYFPGGAGASFAYCSQELTARDEIDALTDTIRRLVDLAPQFTAGGSVEEVAGSICDAAREAFGADAAALWVRHGESAIRMIIRRPATDALPPGVLIDFGRHPGFGDDLESGVPAFIGDIEHAQPELWSEFARGSGSRAQLRLPLATAGRAQAMVVVSWSEPAEAPSRERSALAARFADQAALALAEARRRAAQEDTARLHRRLEHGLLPVIAPHPGIGVVAFYRPGERRMALGGDFYDCVTLDDGSLAMLIGDVSGHGPDAAALGAALRIAWRALLPKCESADDLFRHLEKVLRSERQRASAFATLAQAVVDPEAQRAQITIAGHPHPILRGREAVVPELGWGPALGLPPAGEWPTVELELPRRTELVLYTDGLVEGRAGTDSSERFGQPRLLELLDRIPARLDRSRIAGLVDAISAVNGAPLPDDVAVLAATIG